MLPPEVPGAGEVLCTGMTGCAPSQRESKPSASAFCATTAVSIGCRPENTEIPMFIIASFPVPLRVTWQMYGLPAPGAQCYAGPRPQVGYGSGHTQEQHTTQEDLCTSPSTVLRRVALPDREGYTAARLYAGNHNRDVLLEKESLMRLQRLCTLVLVSVLVLTTTALAQTTLEKVNAGGKLVCGVNTGRAGFAARGSDGMWSGFDVDYCRALAAALFNDASKVEFRPLSAQQRFTALQSGGTDVLSRNTTWTLSRDASLGLDFGPTLFYDGQGMMMPVELHWKLGSSGPRLTLGPQLTVQDLNGASVCVQAGTT